MAKGKKTGGRDFKPGQSGNPKGKPSGIKKEVDNLIKEIGNEETEESISRLESIIRTMYKAAIKGDRESQKFLIERLGGKARQTLAVENALDREWLEIYKGIKNDTITQTKGDMESG